MEKMQTSRTSADCTRSSFTVCFGLPVRCKGRSEKDKQGTKCLHRSFLGLAQFYTSQLKEIKPTSSSKLIASFLRCSGICLASAHRQTTSYLKFKRILENLLVLILMLKPMISLMSFSKKMPLKKIRLSNYMYTLNVLHYGKNTFSINMWILILKISLLIFRRHT